MTPRERLLASLAPELVVAIEALIDERVRKLQLEQQQRPLLTVAEFAARSGRSEKGIRRAIERGQLEPVRSRRQGAAALFIPP